MLKLRAGQNWRFVSVINTWREGRQDGAVYDSSGGPLMALLKCQCGHEWEVDCDELVTKPKTCGREECSVEMGEGEGDRVRRGRPKKWNEPASGMVLYLKLSTQQLLCDLGEKEGVNRSIAAERLIRAGLEYLRLKGEVE